MQPCFQSVAGAADQSSRSWDGLRGMESNIVGVRSTICLVIAQKEQGAAHAENEIP
jgi:hypothetical protein